MNDFVTNFNYQQDLKQKEAFNNFKENWNYAKEQIAKYEKIDEAWSSHKKEHGLRFSAEEEPKRFLTFKENTKVLLQDFKKYVDGETLENPLFFSIYNLHQSKRESEAALPQYGA